MEGVLPLELAKFHFFQTAGRFALIFFRHVIALFAFRARQSDAFPGHIDHLMLDGNNPISQI